MKYLRIQLPLIVNPQESDEIEAKKHAALYRNRLSQDFYMVLKRPRTVEIWKILGNYFVNFFNKDKKENEKITIEAIYNLEEGEIYNQFKHLFYQELRKRNPDYKILPKAWIPQKTAVDQIRRDFSENSRKRKRTEKTTNSYSDEQPKKVDTKQHIAQGHVSQISQQSDSDDEPSLATELEKAHAKDVELGLRPQSETKPQDLIEQWKIDAAYILAQISIYQEERKT